MRKEYAVSAVLCIVMYLLSGSCALGAAESRTMVTIARPDKAPVIVAPAEMEDQVRYSVDDLQNYLQKITGQKILVTDSAPAGAFCINVGDVPANQDLKTVVEKESLGRDGFVLDISNRGVRILGGSKFGTSYGVYELLEKIGVRWLFPGEWGDVVPVMERISLPAGRFTDKPLFNIRAQHAAWVGRPFGDWARRQRQNRDGYFGHSSLISPKKYGAEHPEWYAEIDGKRRVDDPNFKLCHSNQAMVRQAIADVLEELRQRRADQKVVNHIGYLHKAEDYRVISVSPTDGGGFCRCADCIKMGSVSDRVQIFANTIAEAIQKEFPGYFVGYYGAYSEHSAAPTVKAHPNVMVYMTSWSKAFFEPITASRNKDFLEKYESFARQCPNLILRDYDGLAVWWGYGPFSLADVHRTDYPWYYEHGLKGVATEAHTGWGPWGYSYYLTSKLWWNPYADLKALKRDFVLSAYGEASGPMTRYYEILDKARVYPSPSDLYAMRKSLEEAVKIAKHADVRRRLDYLRSYYFLFDAYNHIQAGTAAPDEIKTSLRMLKSIDPYVSPIGEKQLIGTAGLPAQAGAPAEAVVPLSETELRVILDKVVLVKPENLPAWSDSDDYRLEPLSPAADTFNTDMGLNSRYGPHTILIYAKTNERIHVWQVGTSKTEYELTGPEQAVMASGTAEGETIVDCTATTAGIHRLTFSTYSYRPRIHVSNRAAVIKAGSAPQHVHTFGKASFYFFVPKGVKKFTVVGKAEEPLILEIFGPFDAAAPAYPRTTQKSTSFEEHLVNVPAGADGKIWRMTLGGEDKKIFLRGIPPFLTGDPGRLLVLPQ